MTRRGTAGVRVWAMNVSPRVVPWLLLPLAFLLGGAAEHLLAGLSIGEMTRFLEEYGAGCVQQGTVPPDLAALLWRFLRPVLLALVLSCSALGVIGLPLLMGAQGFLAAYTISTLARTWGYNGLLAAAAWVGVDQVILMALLLAIAVPGWVRAWEIAADCRVDRKLPRGYGRRCGWFCLGGLALAVLYEYLIWNTVTPALWARL